jgi:OOP family OmpA-OmpF porin
MKNFFKNATLFTKVLLLLAVCGIIYGVYTILPKSVRASQLVSVDTEDFQSAPPMPYDKTANAPSVPLPAGDTIVGGTEVRAGIMGWISQVGVLYANGGVTPKKGSFMAREGVNLRLINQNNCTEQLNQLYAFIADYAAGNVTSTKGYHLIALMGDGVPGLVTAFNEKIAKEFGEEYIIKVFYAGGASYGEDKFLGRPSAKRDPQNLRGSLVSAVVLDGDWNILMMYCKANNIPVNNDLTTYDPTAVNIYATDDYLKAAELYISGTKEKRPIAINGKLIGRDTTVAIDGVVTWTPGDVNAVTQKGGLVTLASTKEYGNQMPNAWLASGKWMADNRKKVESFIKAAALGGDQVKSHGRALTFATGIAAELFGGLTAQEWEKYYKGFTATDVQGNLVELGGSRVFNLADNAKYFGLNGGVNNYEAVYTVFANIGKEAYPDRLPSFRPVQDIMDLSYVTAVYGREKNNTKMTGASETTKFTSGQTMSSLVSSKNVTIEFQTGSAVISPSSYKTLDGIANDLIVASELLVTINGHTDNTGNAEANITLSQARAASVREWLVNRNPAFGNRITTNGYGQELPIADNTTASGRARNRRVEIKLGK